MQPSSRSTRETGAIRAMTAVYPGRKHNQFNLISQARRQTGSTFKTFVLAAAVEAGMDPESTYYLSSPLHCDTGPCTRQAVGREDVRQHAMSAARRSPSATLRSDNTVYARLTLDVGADKVAKMARKLGVRTPLDVHGAYVPSIGLGSIAVSPLDMASAYATLAAGGIRSKPMAITKVILPNGKRDTRTDWGKPRRTRVISQAVAYEVTQILQQNVLYGTGIGANFGRPAAGKTGTTDEHVDAWFCGYTPQLEATVWVGYPKARDPDGVRARDLGRWAAPSPRRSGTCSCRRHRRSSRTCDFRGARATTDLHLLARRVAVDRRVLVDRHHADLHADVHQSVARRSPRGAAVLGLTAAAVMLAWPSGSPLVPRNGGHPGGDPVWAWWFLGLFAAAFAVYVARASFSCGGRRRAVAVVAALACAIQLVPLGVPLLLSTDAWAYWNYGRLAAVHDANPYEVTPDAFPTIRPTSGSGPTGATRRLSTVPRSRSPRSRSRWRPGRRPMRRRGSTRRSPPSSCSERRCWRRGCRRAPRSPSRSSAGTRCLPCTSPEAVTTTRGLLSSFSVRSQPPPRVVHDSQACAGRSGAFVKWVPLVLLPLRAIEARRSGRRVDHVGFAAAAAAVALLAFVRYGTGWLHVFASLARNANGETSWALPHRLEQAGAPRAALTIAVFGLAFALAYAWLVREAWRGRARLGLATGALLLAAPYLVVWYVVWAVPLAAAEDDEPAALLSLALCAYLLRQTIPL